MIDKMELGSQALHIRKKLGVNESSPIDIFSLVQSVDRLTLILYPLGRSISGACFKSELSALIAINTDMSIGRQRYTLAHELYHLYFDENTVSNVCSMQISNENERRADQFASFFLMPPVALYEALQKCDPSSDGKLSLPDIIRLEQYFGISHRAMLNRLTEENKITSADARSMSSGIIKLATKLGYDAALYKPSPQQKKVCVLGHYICQAEKLLQANVISNGKYEEYLLDAFRTDIVFGDESEEELIID